MIKISTRNTCLSYIKGRQYSDRAKELNKLGNMKAREILVITGALCMVPKGLIRGLEELKTRGSTETISNYSFTKIDQNTKKSFQRLEKTCCHRESNERPSANAGVKINII